MKPIGVYAVFFLALFSVGAAAPLARLTDGAHPLSIGFWRVFLIGLPMLGLVGLPKLSRRDWAFTVLATLCLVFHFWAWFASIEQTTILRSTVLVCLNPLWVGLWEWMQTRAFNKQFWLGTLLALIGAVVMSTVGDVSALSKGSLQGDLLAVLAGLLGSVYLICSSDLRNRVSTTSYTAVLSVLSALLFIALTSMLNLEAVGESVEQIDLLADFQEHYWIFIVMAVGPQLMGHVGLTWCLKWLSASIVALGLLFEPVGAALLAWLWFGEVPTVFELLGALLIVMGVGIGTQDPELKDV